MYNFKLQTLTASSAKQKSQVSTIFSIHLVYMGLKIKPQDVLTNVKNYVAKIYMGIKF